MRGTVNCTLTLMALVIMKMNNINIFSKYKCITEKINKNDGFSLTETLTTLVIMSFVGIMITTGLTTSIRVYKKVTEYNNAQLMLTNTITALHDELIYSVSDDSYPVITGGNKITFNHIQKGIETIKFDSTEGNMGIYIGYEDDTTSGYSPLVSYQNSASLYNNWNIVKDGNLFLISVSIYKSNGDGTTPLISVDNYKVKPLN